MAASNVLIYLMRRDLRLSDNPIFHHLASTKHGFTHMIPVYVFPAHQIEISGFIKDGTSRSPYPEARSQVAGYWRCGIHRSKFICETLWDLKQSLEKVGSGLILRAGKHGDILDHLIEGLEKNGHKVGAVWMTGEESVEELRDEKAVRSICDLNEIEFRRWDDEKYFVDDRDTSINQPSELPDVFSEYKKREEPLREKPRPTLATPGKESLPPLPPRSDIPSQPTPFVIPDEYSQLEKDILLPLKDSVSLISPFPTDFPHPHPFKGGETVAQSRLHHLVKSGVMHDYDKTRNGLVGTEYSTKLSAHLALGSLTARQIHERLLQYEDGDNDDFKETKGYGDGENTGTKMVRFELLWRDYMRHYTQKFRHRLFRRDGCMDYKGKEPQVKWKVPTEEGAPPDQNPSPKEIAKIIKRFEEGTLGMGLIDASQRELNHTGYNSNRTRQNVASFLAKHLYIDWRYGAEYYEMMLVDHDVHSNWSNWQYVSGVGNDPRGESRIFNPVKQAFDYDRDGSYVRAWVPEVASLEKLENVFQVSTTSQEELEAAGLTDNIMVTNPVKRIQFSVQGRPRNPRRPYRQRRGGSSQPTGSGPESTSDHSSGAGGRGGGQGFRGGYSGPRGGYQQNPNNFGRGGFRGGRGGGFPRGRGYSNTPRGGYRGYGPPQYAPGPVPNGWVPPPQHQQHPPHPSHQPPPNPGT